MESFFQRCWLMMQRENPRLRQKCLEIELRVAGLSLPKPRKATLPGSQLREDDEGRVIEIV